MALKVVGSNPIIHPRNETEAFASVFSFLGWIKWDSKGRPERSEGKKVSGGHFLSLWENPGAADGIPMGCWQLLRIVAEKFWGALFLLDFTVRYAMLTLEWRYLYDKNVRTE